MGQGLEQLIHAKVGLDDLSVGSEEDDFMIASVVQDFSLFGTQTTMCIPDGETEPLREFIKILEVENWVPVFLFVIED
jgi:hypothetical protein